MKLPQALKSDVKYAKNLVGAGLDGINSARKESDKRVFTPALARTVWAPVAIGAAVGVLAACLKCNRKSHHAVVGGLVGSVLGFSGGVAWASRGITGAAARGAISKVNVVRDAHWLEKNPIAYA
jgi:hypothetical protein